MKILNIKTKYDIDDCKKIIDSKVISQDSIGINWLYKKNNKIVLYYEDGTKTTRDGYKLAKAYFIGKIIKKKQDVYLKGIIVVSPIISALFILSIIHCIVELFMHKEIIMLIFAALLFYTFLFMIKNNSNNKLNILKYLNDVFGSTDDRI